MKLFFSHPTFTFKTETERKCLDIIEDHIEPDKIINPSDYGLKHDLKSDLEEADSIVAMAVSNTFTYIVWKELEFLEKKDPERYTFMVENKEEIGPLVKGIPDRIKKLSKEESKKLSHKITKDDYQDGFLTSLMGSHRSRF